MVRDHEAVIKATQQLSKSYACLWRTLLGVKHSVSDLTALTTFGRYPLALHCQQQADVLKHWSHIALTTLDIPLLQTIVIAQHFMLAAPIIMTSMRPLMAWRCTALLRQPPAECGTPRL